MCAGPALAQTVGDGAKTSLTGTKIGGVNRTDSTGVVYGEGSVPGSLPNDDVARDRDFTIRYTNLINNYASKTTPSATAGDSSTARALNGASKINLVIYAIASDSATSVRHQLMFVQVRYGFGTTTDSTGAFPVMRGAARITDETGADSIVVAPALVGIGNGGNLYSALQGEIPIHVSPIASAGGAYDYAILTPEEYPALNVPVGATYVSVRVRPGATFLRTGAAAGAWAKGAMGYRVDLFGGRP
jgi:hypothetical protein